MSGDRTAALAVESTWRSDAASMLGVLARRLGDLDRAEEALQEAMAEALAHWPTDGVPDRPAGWLMTTAWRKAVDRLRRDATGQAKISVLTGDAKQAVELEPTDDDRLATIFACCHPALGPASRIALTLHAASGLSTRAIAAAFLVPQATMAQRLVRAKRRLREAGVSFAPPTPAEAAERLPTVLDVIYLVFNEGYLAADGDAPQRRELAREALELARQVAALVPTEPEAAGLAALLELHEARAATRFDEAGRLVLLEEQDRDRWDRGMIARALARLLAALAAGRPGPYQLQASIAAQHAVARSFAETDWARIRAHYDLLYGLQPSPVVLLNRAVATRYVHGPQAAMDEIEAVAPRLGEYRLLYAIRADLLLALGRPEDAAAATRRAIGLTTNPAEREVLARRLRSATARMTEGRSEVPQ